MVYLEPRRRGRRAPQLGLILLAALALVALVEGYRMLVFYQDANAVRQSLLSLQQNLDRVDAAQTTEDFRT